MTVVRPRRIALIAVASLALGGFLLYGLLNQPDENDQPLGLNPSFAKFEAPALQGKTLDGETFDLTSLRGKPVVVNFWASWCGPCNKEAPELVRFAAQNRAHVVGVNIDDKGGNARSFARKYGLDFPLCRRTSTRSSTTRARGCRSRSSWTPTAASSTRTPAS